ncbi:homoserine kinase [Bacillus sp. REN3]|uniref:homoserine kinase n=1 Tax=Bacillus sp. REN3 TaxID=2802440 RepID=UPI001FEE7B8D|nr:homoserine kinase [Bacillus sp. REN3]
MNQVEDHMDWPSVSQNTESVMVKVPASSANLGPGFDSYGVALSLYLTVTAERNANWEVIHQSEDLMKFPRDESNFICQTAIHTAKMYKQEMPPLKVLVHSDIPLARGLGSSAAAIVAGIELADRFCSLGLSQVEKLRIAAKLEGHPDNVGASLYGGVVVGSQIGEDVNLTVLQNIEFDPVLVIPGEELLTESSREVLPKTVAFSYAVQASAIANQLLAAFMVKDWKLAGKMMDADMFHQPFRKGLVPGFESIREKALEGGAFGAAISGAGPSVLCLAEPGKGKQLAETLKASLEGMEVRRLEIERNGCQS